MSQSKLSMESTPESPSMEQIPSTPLPPITQEQLRAYAHASGDHNPIHLDESVARASGLPGVIAHGMLSAAFIAEGAIRALEERTQYQGYRIQRCQCRFKVMVTLGDQISVGGAIKHAGPNALVVELQARNQRGEVVTTGSIEFQKGV
jgi:acyl dehydratase